MKSFEKEIEIRWADCDMNRHVRHSAYYDYGAQSRINFFSHINFSAQKMARLNLGPVLFKEECSFIKELHMGDTVRINLLRGEISTDGSRWELHHEIFNDKDEKCAHITVKGAWIDLIKRKLTNPPVELLEPIDELPLGSHYVRISKKLTTTV